MALLDLELTSDGDLILDGSGRPTNLIGQQAVNQIVRQLLKLWRGDWSFDTERGVDWPSILQKRINRTAIIQTISLALLQSQYVETVVDVFINVDRSTRVATLTYVVFADGELVEGGEEI